MKEIFLIGLGNPGKKYSNSRHNVGFLLLEDLSKKSNQEIQNASALNQKEILFKNTENFSKGFPSNNALLWGAKGTGKSSLIKSVHSEILEKNPTIKLKLIEIHREDIIHLTNLLEILSNNETYRFILLCDDLSFDQGENTYKSLKSILDGGIEGKPSNTIFYATSNRRHLMPRDMIDNEKSTSINPSETIEENDFTNVSSPDETKAAS